MVISFDVLQCKLPEFRQRVSKTFSYFDGVLFHGEGVRRGKGAASGI